ncbi:MAG: triose-phosphate isomerase [Geminicoccaceae bacterium]
MHLERPIIVGNWKMNGLQISGCDLAKQIAASLAARHADHGTVAVCPPATLLAQVGAKLAGSEVLLGGQDCHSEASGAFTGSVSPVMLKDQGCDLVIVGHSERRHGLGETDADVLAKATGAITAGLMPIVCIGETEAEYRAGETLAVLSRQIHGSLPVSREQDGLIVAYEPVWAIGTGLTPTIEEIAATHAHIKEQIAGHLGVPDADVPVLYGGSVKPANAAEILALEGVDGVLVGGASLKAEDFLAIHAAGASPSSSA